MIEPTSIPRQSTALSVESQLQAALAQTQQWLTFVDSDQPANEFSTSSGLGRIGVDGPGLLAFDDHGHRVFARQATLAVRQDGYIVDERGALLLGYSGGRSGDPAPLRVPVDGKALADVRIDGDGQIAITMRPSQSGHDRQPPIVGRVALAVPAFPQSVPGQAQRVSQEYLGVRPRYLPAGTVHLGSIRLNPSVISSDAVRATIRSLWSASGRGELEVALAASIDTLERVALNLVR
jgi:hypothetical protein